MNITSPAFEQNGQIPRKYSAFGENINPPLNIADLPEGTKSLTLIVDDPDVPPTAGVEIWDHWLVFNIPPNVTYIPEHWEIMGTAGQGTRGSLTYSGPKPPDKEHRYFFQVYALDADLDLPAGSTKDEVLTAMEGHILDQAELVGRYAPEAEPV